MAEIICVKTSSVEHHIPSLLIVNHVEKSWHRPKLPHPGLNAVSILNQCNDWYIRFVFTDFLNDNVHCSLSYRETYPTLYSRLREKGRIGIFGKDNPPLRKEQENPCRWFDYGGWTIYNIELYYDIIWFIKILCLMSVLHLIYYTAG